MKYKLLSTLFLFTIIGTFNNAQAQIKSNFKTSNQKTKTFNNPWQFSSEPDSKTLKQKSQIRQIIPDETFEQFEIQESSIMHSDLVAKSPQIKSYFGQEFDDLIASRSEDISHKGFHTVNKSVKHITDYIDPYARGNTKDYIVNNSVPIDTSLEAVFTVDKEFVVPGDTVTFNLTLLNKTDSILNNIDAQASLPIFSSYLSGGTLNNDTIYFSTISLNPQQSITLSFQVQVNGNIPSDIVYSFAKTTHIINGINTQYNQFISSRIVESILQLDVSIFSEASCYGDSIFVTGEITGGYPIEFENNNYYLLYINDEPAIGATTTIAVLPVNVGINTFRVQDLDNQIAYDTIIISQPDSLSLNISTTSMNGSNNGTADLTFSGGVSPHTFSWSNGASTQNLSGLAAGDYTVTITDANSCTKSATTTIIDKTCYDHELALNILMGDPTSTLQWFVQDMNGGNVLQGYGQFEDNMCLPVGCYTFSMIDINGTFCCDQGTDCCDSDIGDYFLIDNTNNDTIFMSNGQFQSFESTFFCINDLPTISYCSSSASSQLFEWIETVQIGSINQTSGENGGYADFTSLYTVAHIGDTVSLSLTPGFRYGPYDEHWKVWVDYNRDGDFLDPNEEVFSAFGQSTVAGSFIIPDSVVVSDLRIRVSMQYNTPSASCEAFSYGEVEDYTLIIASSSSNPFQNDVPAALQVNSDLNDRIEKRDEENQVELVQKTSLKVYPNPVKDILQIDITLPDNTQGNLIITDINGSIIQPSQIISTTESRRLNVQNLASGIYFVHFLSDHSKITEKFIVIR